MLQVDTQTLKQTARRFADSWYGSILLGLLIVFAVIAVNYGLLRWFG
jgi:hypothetical protein